MNETLLFFSELPFHLVVDMAGAMPAYSASLRLPPQLDINSGNVSENFKHWKRQVEVYLAASGGGQTDDAVQTAILLNCAGPHVVEIYDQITWWEGADKEKPTDVLKALAAYCNPRDNEVLESFRFWNVQYQDPFDKFLTELKTRATACNFQEKDRMLRDKIVFTVTGKLQELLLREDKLTLDKAVKVCRAFEQSNRQVKEIRDMSTPSQSVNKVFHKPSGKPASKPNKFQGSRHPQKPTGRHKIDCNFCGYQHEGQKEKCPAWDKTCRKCQGRNHFASRCKKDINSVAKEVEDTPSQESGDQDVWLASINNNDNDSVKATMCVNGLDVHFQLDSGADVNTINQKHVKRDQVTPTKVKLNMWNRTNVTPKGECTLTVTNPRTKVESEVKFVVVPNGLTNLLGLETIQKLGFVTINDECFISQVKAPQLGDLGEATLTTDDTIPAKILPCRKIPIAIQSLVEKELDRLVDKGVLVPMTEPTKWVSQMAVVHKADGKLRLCIDPQPLNVALMREHYRLPVLDDVLPKLKNAKVFSKLDVKEAYWHVRLDDASSKLTTMITPFGRYRWTRLPFGLKVSSEIFQRKLDEALGDLDGVFCIVDDVIIAGCGQTEADAEKDNQRKLAKVLEKCAEKNIILNDDKKETGLREIVFHGHRITKDGVKVDEAKVRAIRDMPRPTDVSGVKRLCGMVQYMARFLPDLAGTLEPIRTLTRKDTPFIWSAQCDKAFNTLKKNLTESPVLAYFDSSKEVRIQVDSSKDGIGAVLLQDGRPVEYASRALTPSERNWAQIEKESLSVLFGLERFDQYTYGRPVIVENDHKPLAAILKKPLSMAPKRLQDIMMRFYRYDVEFVFVKGVNLVLADTLSRAYLDTSIGNLDERARIMSVNTFGDIPDARLEEIREATLGDESLQTIINLVLEGWPENKRETPSCASPYFDFRDTLSYVDGILLKGEAVVIPATLRSSMKIRLHSAHLGYDSMLRRARGTVYWSGMASDIRQIADACVTCQEAKPRNQKEPLSQHDEGDDPWEKVGLDLFEIQGKQYLVVVDYYSNFVEVELLTTTTSARVVTLLKKQFARLGIPKVIVSDGGPQFVSQEFKTFVSNWGIIHMTSSPMHQQANGKAESAVKIMKTLLVKTYKEGGDPYEAMLEQRNTPRQDTGRSPAEMLFKRRTRSFLPHVVERDDSQKVKVKREARKRVVKKHYDRKARQLSEIDVGQSVFFQHMEGKNWRLGRVTEILGPRTYVVQGPDGGVYRRNRVHMRPTKIAPKIRDLSPNRDPPLSQTTPRIDTTPPKQHQEATISMDIPVPHDSGGNRRSSDVHERERDSQTMTTDISTRPKR
jgi:hypothetical protein